MDKDLIQSIKITERNCIVTVFETNTKHILLTKGIEIRNRYIQLDDIENQVTNIAIEDARVNCPIRSVLHYASIHRYGTRLSTQRSDEGYANRNRDPIFATDELCNVYSNYE